MNNSPRFLFALIFAAVSLTGFLLAAQAVAGGGYPLDDAWIHQTYARNLGVEGRWMFQPGASAGGSTAPLWSGMLALGYLFSIPRLWTIGMGWLSLALIVWAGMRYGQQEFPEKPWAVWFIGGILAIEWHLVWAAGSGMETGAFSALVLVILVGISRGELKGWLLGGLIGLAIWLRPDGVTLLGPAAFVIIFERGKISSRIRRLLFIFGGMVIFFALYLGFNQLTAGAWWPNTLAAKQTEYAILTEQSYFIRYIKLANLPLAGSGILVLPGFIYFASWAYRSRHWGVLAGSTWVLGYIGLYAWKLPVIYQHGRYLMPAMGVYLLWGLIGCLKWVRLKSQMPFRRVLSRVWIVAILAVGMIFYFLGLKAYGRDVALINSEMVHIAHWVAEATPEDAVIAAHDIGALGYYGNRRLVDLAGLVSPDVIPFMRDELRLEEYLDFNNVDYLVAFPSWYPYLSMRGDLIYTSTGEIAPALGQDNMSVYAW